MIYQTNKEKDAEDLRIKNKQPKPYTVKVEAFVPATITYVVNAVTPEEAANSLLLKQKQPKNVLYKLPQVKMKKITVYEYGMSIIKFIKNLF